MKRVTAAKGLRSFSGRLDMLSRTDKRVAAIFTFETGVVIVTLTFVRLSEDDPERGLRRQIGKGIQATLVASMKEEAVPCKRPAFSFAWNLGVLSFLRKQ